MANMNYAAPEGFTLDPQSGRYYRYESIVQGQQWVTWFDATTGQYEQASYPAPPAPQKSGQKNLAIAVIVCALVACGVFGGHYMGLYALPFLADSANEETDSIEVVESETASESNTDDISQAQPTATPTPPVAATPTPTPETPPPDDDVIVEPQGPVALNLDLAALIGQTNRELIAVNGKDDGIIYYWGGGVWADYMEMNVQYPVRFLLKGDNDRVNEILEQIYATENSSSHIGNIWPNDFVIDGIEVQQGPYDFNTTLQDLFRADVPLNYDNISASFTKDGVLSYWPLEEQVYDGHGFDVWVCNFLDSDYRIACTFYKPNDELMLYQALIWLEN